MPELGGTVYVYGVLEGPPPPRVVHRGVGGSDVTAVEHEGLIALTSRLNDTVLAARDVRAHWAVLESAFEDTTVLPLRFGTALESEDAVRERLLEANAQQLRDLLRDMTGLVQLNLKARYDEQVLLREIVLASPAVAQLRDRLQSAPGGVENHAEQIRLGQLVGDAVARRREQDTAVALDALAPLAVATRTEQAAHPVAFNLAFLVERARRDRFDEAVTWLRDELGGRIEVRYVGPLPPYSFADAQLNSGSPGWD